MIVMDVKVRDLKNKPTAKEIAPNTLRPDSITELPKTDPQIKTGGGQPSVSVGGQTSVNESQRAKRPLSVELFMKARFQSKTFVQVKEYIELLEYIVDQQNHDLELFKTECQFKNECQVNTVNTVNTGMNNISVDSGPF